MIEFFYEVGLEIDEEKYTDWIITCVKHYGQKIDCINYVFADDEFLLDKNRTYLNHDYYTDILTFPEETGSGLAADILISVDRVEDNAENYKITFEEELRRVMIHGVLHILGYDDSHKRDKEEMRKQEEVCLAMFHVKH